VTVRETVNASKERFGDKDLMGVLGDATRVIVAKGKKVVEFDLKGDPPTKAELVKACLGPSGNLRAPAIRKGKTWMIGFNPESYGELF
jgi:arsenate reductase-like glutaredoxin family protein